MMIRELSIEGFRGFGRRQTLHFSLPDGETPGKGLNVIVGGNNAGKTTIIEAIRAFNLQKNATPTFTEGRRNKTTGEVVRLELTDEQDRPYRIQSKDNDYSETVKTPNDFSLDFYVLQSRRFVPYEFFKEKNDRTAYVQYHQKLPDKRSGELPSFQKRIFKMADNKTEIDTLLKRVLGQSLKWGLEKRENGYYYIKYNNHGVTHSSEGLGDGIWSIFTICDALYDANPNTTIVIDEPELSLHPSLQKRLLDLLVEQSKDKQIILCTHSPYFVSWEAIFQGGALIRVVKEGATSVCYQLTEECVQQFGNLLGDWHNPHILGLNATEALFLDDNIILVEGQEDVLLYSRIARELGVQLRGEFFGWGVGGAPNISHMLRLLQDLGYKHVAAIFDGDQKKLWEKAKAEFQDQDKNYKLFLLYKDDVRDKPACTKHPGEPKPGCYRAPKEGIADEQWHLKDTERETVKAFLEEVNATFPVK